MKDKMTMWHYLVGKYHRFCALGICRMIARTGLSSRNPATIPLSDNYKIIQFVQSLSLE